MGKSGLYAIALVAIITLLGLVYLALTWEAPEGITTVVLSSPVEAEPEAAVVVPQRRLEPPSPLPTIRIEAEPNATAAAETEVAPPPTELTASPAPVEPELPGLGASDDLVQGELRALQNGAQLLGLLAEEQLIRRFVTLVENVSRGTLPQSNLPFRGINGEFPVRNLDENLFVMDASAHSRFDAAISTFVSIDPDAAMALYRMLAPLFQQAYAELGYRDADFNDTLRSAIDNVLAFELPPPPYQLVKPSVMYLFADSRLENLPDVHKQLIRLGPNNTDRLKASLREFRARL